MAQRQFRSDDTSVWPYKFGDGTDGDLTISADTTEAPIDASCTASAGSNSISATNVSFAAGQIILIHKTRGNTTTAAGTWELNKIQSYVAGTITTVLPMVNDYQDSGADQSQVRVLKQYNNVTINTTKTYTSKVWDGNLGGILAFCANGVTTINGSITATGKGYIADQGGVATQATGKQGEGHSAAGGGQATGANGSGGGGGAGSIPTIQTEPVGSGGGGGHVNAGADGSTPSRTNGTGGTGGLGTAGLTTMLFGGAGGGSGANGYYGGGSVGGHGGGIVLIITRSIVVAGGIATNGNGTGDYFNNAAGGGSGAGGSVLIKAQMATLGTTLITAIAGTAYRAGGNGSVGRIHLDYSAYYTGTTSPALDARLDGSLADAGGSFIQNML